MVAATTTAVPPTGGISITSTPSGASVSIDGAVLGTTPFTLDRATAGTHAVLLRLPAYNDITASIEVTPGQTVSQQYRLIVVGKPAYIPSATAVPATPFTGIAYVPPTTTPPVTPASAIVPAPAPIPATSGIQGAKVVNSQNPVALQSKRNMSAPSFDKDFKSKISTSAKNDNGIWGIFADLPFVKLHRDMEWYVAMPGTTADVQVWTGKWGEHKQPFIHPYDYFVYLDDEQGAIISHAIPAPWNAQGTIKANQVFYHFGLTPGTCVYEIDVVTSDGFTIVHNPDDPANGWCNQNTNNYLGANAAYDDPMYDREQFFSGKYDITPQESLEGVTLYYMLSAGDLMEGHHASGHFFHLISSGARFNQDLTDYNPYKG